MGGLGTFFLIKKIPPFNFFGKLDEVVKFFTRFIISLYCQKFSSCPSSHELETRCLQSEDNGNVFHIICEKHMVKDNGIKQPMIVKDSQHALDPELDTDVSRGKVDVKSGKMC